MKCPGQDTRYWRPGDIFEADCPHCGSPVEFFKDESSRRCRKCRKLVTNPRMDFGCAAYCKYAEECLGELSPDLLAQRKDLLKDRVAIEMKKYFRQDFRSINHAMKVSRYAEQIAAEEKADPAVILSAAYLHGIACPEAESAGPEAGAVCGGLGSVKALLEGLGATEEMTGEVLDVISALRQNGGADAYKSVRILRDAHTIAESQERQERQEQGLESGGPLKHTVSEILQTDGGRTIVKKLLSQGETT